MLRLSPRGEIAPPWGDINERTPSPVKGQCERRGAPADALDARSDEIKSLHRRHTRACRRHPHLSCGFSAIKTWMAGTSPAIALNRCSNKRTVGWLSDSETHQACRWRGRRWVSLALNPPYVKPRRTPFSSSTRLQGSGIRACPRAPRIAERWPCRKSRALAPALSEPAACASFAPRPRRRGSR
jgi:hypothetical protein